MDLSWFKVYFEIMLARRDALYMPEIVIIQPLIVRLIFKLLEMFKAYWKKDIFAGTWQILHL